MIQMRRLLLAVPAALVVALAGASGAHADGAQVSHFDAKLLNGCKDNGVETICIDFHGASQIVTTPSGTFMTNTEFGGTMTTSFDDGSASVTQDFRHLGEHTVVNPVGASEFEVHETLTDTTTGCTVEIAEHATTNPDGTTNIQYMRQSSTCTP